MATRYWVVSLPVPTSASSLWSRLQESISKHSFDTPLYRVIVAAFLSFSVWLLGIRGKPNGHFEFFNTPDLRVGTLDSLLSLSDDLLKSNSFVEGVTHKIRRQIEELERGSGGESNALTVDGVPVDSYLTRFVWDEAKYPTMSPLREIVDGIHVQVAKIEDDLKLENFNMHKMRDSNIKPTMSYQDYFMRYMRKLFMLVAVFKHVPVVRVAEYNNVRSQLNAINRKQTGSLAVRDLSNLVKPEDIITSEHLVTLLAVVPKYSQKDWLSTYETLATYVVPRSSKKLHEDNEYALYTVTIFGRVADNFKTSARERGFQIRDFEYSPETQESRKQELEKLMLDQDTIRTSLLQWCYTSYGEVFSSWMHFCAVRVFAESILRYGLPPSFLSVVLAPSVKSEKKARSILEVTIPEERWAEGNGNNSDPSCDISVAKRSGGPMTESFELLPCDPDSASRQEMPRASVFTYWKSEDELGGMGSLGGDADSHPYVSFTINLV
ncbi:V-type proton ATPase subunit C [Vitis vinifera]|uniref:V-type proton ATPase subunit C n=1 Tax=Vitis vinifera TaxID=29760 RepID=A0A438K9L5_VITVI|nr:V-type proton ATPase subunit C [Vitis vinifera]